LAHFYFLPRTKSLDTITNIMSIDPRLLQRTENFIADCEKVSVSAKQREKVAVCCKHHVVNSQGKETALVTVVKVARGCFEKAMSDASSEFYHMFMKGFKLESSCVLIEQSPMELHCVHCDEPAATVSGAFNPAGLTCYPPSTECHGAVPSCGRDACNLVARRQMELACSQKYGVLFFTQQEGCSCETCGRPQARPQEHQRCCRCRAVFYCSSDCQKKHWKSHKEACDVAFFREKYSTRTRTFVHGLGKKAQ
jgi:hypothetical protein